MMAQAATLRRAMASSRAGGLATSVRVPGAVRLPHDADSWRHDAAFFAGGDSAHASDGVLAYEDDTAGSYCQQRERARRAALETEAEELEGASLRKRVRPPHRRRECSAVVSLVVSRPQNTSLIMV